MDIVNGRKDGRTDKATTICSPFGEHKNDVQCTLTCAGSGCCSGSLQICFTFNNVYVGFLNGAVWSLSVICCKSDDKIIRQTYRDVNV